MTNENIQRTLGELVEQGKWVAVELHEMKKDIKEVRKAHLSLLKDHWNYYSPEHGYELFVVKGVPDFQGNPVTYIELPLIQTHLSPA